MKPKSKLKTETRSIRFTKSQLSKCLDLEIEISVVCRSAIDKEIDLKLAKSQKPQGK